MVKLPTEAVDQSSPASQSPSRVQAIARCLAWGSILLLTACATPSEPRIVTKEVRVAVPVPCASRPPPEQPFSDSNEALRAAGDLFEQVRLLLAGRAQRDARLTELRASVAGCGG